jgi:hypothetical protein
MKILVNTIAALLILINNHTALAVPAETVLTLKETELGPDCSDGVFSTEDIDGNLVKRDTWRLDKAICLFHAATDGDEKKVAKSIELFQDAEQRGLGPLRQNAAFLFEGLGHCKQAAVALDKWRQTGLEKLQFCTSWRQGRSSLSAVDWKLLDIEYSAGDAEPTHSFLDVIETYQGCYAELGPLSDDYTSDCGFIKDMAWEKIEEVSDAEIETQIADNFGGDTAPVTAMFMRKYGAIKANAKKIQKANEALQTKVKSVADKVGPLNDEFTSKQNERSQIVDNYKEFILRANTILSAIDKLKRGLLVNADGEDLNQMLDGTKDLLKDELDYFEQTGEDQELPTLAQAVKNNIRARNDIGSVNRKQCQIYFCYLLSQRMLQTTKTVSNDFQYFDNPLRVTLDNTIDDGQIAIEMDDGELIVKSVEDICRDAEFNEDYITVNLDLVSSRQCLIDFSFDQ